jgi:hypothetical protein
MVVGVDVCAAIVHDQAIDRESARNMALPPTTFSTPMAYRPAFDRFRHPGPAPIRLRVAILVVVLWLTPCLFVLAQHPRDLPAWPEPAEPPCAEVEPDARPECESREAMRLSERARISREYHGWLADRLAEDGGARNLAIAVQLRAMSLSGALYELDDTLPALEGDARIASWIERAMREGRDDALVHMLLNRRFSSSDAPRLAALRAQWMRIAPDNLVPAMFDAEARANAADTLPALARDASRFDVYWAEQLRTVVDAFLRHPPGPAHAAVLLEEDTSTVRSYAATMALYMVEFPRFVDAINACRGDALTRSPERRGDCLQLGSLLADRSDTLIAHVMGLAILVRAADDEAGRAAAEDRRRLTGWQMHKWQVLSAETPAEIADAVTARALPSATSELDLMRAALTHHGIDLAPPPCWKHTPLQ